MNEITLRNKFINMITIIMAQSKAIVRQEFALQPPAEFAENANALNYHANKRPWNNLCNFLSAPQELRDSKNLPRQFSPHLCRKTKSPSNLKCVRVCVCVCQLIRSIKLSPEKARRSRPHSHTHAFNSNL